MSTWVRDVEELLADPPVVHDDLHGGRTSWALHDDVLRFLASRVDEKSSTLETGEGVSTVLFALHRCRHTCVTPNAVVVERLQTWCQDHHVSLDTVEFALGPSQEVLPHLPATPLDLVLIDGGHGFPLPFVDFLYTAPRLRVGGLLLVDDVQIWTGDVLRRFLRDEPQWQMEWELPGRTVVFRRIAEAPVLREWMEQPFVVRNAPGAPLLPRLFRGLRLLARGDVSTVVERLRELAARPR